MSDRQQETDFQLKTFFPYLVRVFYRDVSQSVKDVYSTVYGLSVAEWRTMAVLNDFEPLSAKEIVARSSMDKVNVSRAVTGLQKGRLLERHVDPTDRRRVLLRLTPKGRKVMRELVPHIREVERKLLAGLDARERQILLELMQKVRDNAASISPFSNPAGIHRASNQ